MLDAGLVAFALSAGALTFFAPCAYPLLPGYVSFYLGHGLDDAATDGGATIAAPAGRFGPVPGAVLVALVVSAGFFAVYALLAGVVVAFGASLLANVSVLELVVGVLLVGLGGAMVVGWKPNVTVLLPERRRGPLAFFGFGVVYAAAAAGCTAPLFVAVALRALAAGPTAAVVTLGAYAAGMAALMVLVTVLTALGRGWLLRRLSARTGLLYRVAGAVLIVAGLVQLYFFLVVFEGAALLGL